MQETLDVLAVALAAAAPTAGCGGDRAAGEPGVRGALLAWLEARLKR